MNDDDVNITKRPIEFDASLVMSVEQIHKSLIRHRNYEEIRTFLDALYEDINLVDS